MGGWGWWVVESPTGPQAAGRVARCVCWRRRQAAGADTDTTTTRLAQATHEVGWVNGACPCVGESI